MKMMHKNTLLGVCLSAIFAATAIFGVLVGGAQSQTRVQCESWLQGLLTSQSGIQYILSNIHAIVAERNRAWIAKTQSAGQTTQEPQTPQEPSLEIIRVATKITEKNNAYYKFSWILTVKNDADSSKSFTARIEWLDEDGFIIDDDIAYDLTIAAGEEKLFTGYALTDAEVAETISNVRAKIPTHTIRTTPLATSTVQPASANISQ